MKEGTPDMGEAAKKVTSTEFIDVLMRQGNGATNQELSDELREIVQRVQSTGKTGTLTLGEGLHFFYL